MVFKKIYFRHTHILHLKKRFCRSLNIEYLKIQFDATNVGQRFRTTTNIRALLQLHETPIGAA